MESSLSSAAKRDALGVLGLKRKEGSGIIMNLRGRSAKACGENRQGGIIVKSRGRPIKLTEV